MESEISIAVVCLLGSFATFFSGFGLGTILLPVFSLYFPIELAILATALVHFANNIFKLSLMAKHVDLNLFKRFGIAALIGAIVGASVLNLVGHAGNMYASPIWEGKSVTYVSFFVGLLMLFFVVFEWKSIRFPFSQSPYFLPLGGLLSGFFGGFSGHQGALRSAFLSKIQLDKQLFVATSALISLLIDLSRISIYSSSNSLGQLNVRYLIIGGLSAFAGSLLGKRYLNKVSYRFIQWMVGIFLTLMGLLILSGGI
ncbi:MAG: hypothetical protein RLZZ30_1584 [Bacteroidota bacterium]|jgi:uncharacterized membrane protein YfcA